METDILVYVGVLLAIIALMYMFYRLGRLDGKYEEREHVLDVFESISLKDLSPETRYSVLYVTRAIVTRLKEGW
jgi:hypothetical protein